MCTHVCNARPLPTPLLFRRYEIQRPHWTWVLYVIRIDRRFRPKWFLKVLPSPRWCNLHTSPLQGRFFLLNAMEICFPVLFVQNSLILCCDFISINALNSFNRSKHYHLDLNTYNHYFLKNLLMKITKYLAPPMNVVLYGATHVGMHNLQKLNCLFSPFVQKQSPMLFASNAHFTK